MADVQPDIGPYRLIRPLGQGGMGTVWLAHDTRLGRQVAIKLLAGDSASDAGRTQMLREARAAAALTHPHIAGLHDVLDADGSVAIVFEYVEGETLAARLTQGPLPVNVALGIASQLALALATAHEHGIIHRDLKPANVIIAPDGTAKVLDFGVARVLPRGGDGATRAETTVASFVGTVGYAAPEQCLGQSVDARADVFSLGVMLFEMLTGEPPFSGDLAKVVRAMLSGGAPRVRDRLPSLRVELERLVARMLATDRSQRLGSAREVLGELQALSAPEVPMLPLRRSGRLVATGFVAATLLMVGAVITMLWPGGPPPLDRLPVVAVLPLANASGDPGKDYLAVGVADSIVTRLAALPSVTVLSRSAVTEATARGTSIPDLARELDVTFFIDGSVQQMSDGLRMSLTLVERDGAVRWADTVEGPVQTLFALQTRVADALSQALSVQLSAAERASLADQPTSVPAALDAYWRGRALLERRDVRPNADAALTAFEEALELDTRFADAHAARGEALWAKYVLTKEPLYAEQAIRAGNEALRLAPERPQVRYALAVTLSGSGKLPEAAEELQRALVLRPNYDDARRLLGSVLARQGRIDEAVSEFRKAIALRPRYWEHHSALGVELAQAGRYVEAADAFREVVRLRPNSAQGYLNLGFVYYMLDDTNQALEYFRRATALAPNPAAHSNIGAIQHKQGDYAAAVAAYQQSIALRPNSHIAHRNLGDALRRLSRGEEAREAYRKALALARAELAVAPSDPRLKAYLAIYLAKLDEPALALDAINEALSIGPDDIQVLFRAGVVHALGGRTEAAIAALRQAVAGGFSRSLIRDDEDLEVLKQLAGFQELTTPTSP